MQAMSRRKWMGLAATALLAAMTPAVAEPAPLVIFAAASLKNALDAAASLYAAQPGKAPPRISYAASNTLARQIEQGAPADIFLSADLEWMDYLASKSLIRPETRVNLLGNRLVLIGPPDAAAIDLKNGLDLVPALAGGRLALCNDAVPAGKYGKAALESLGAWNGIKDRLAPAENVRAALLFVARGEAPLGIVYRTDAAAAAQLKILGTFPEESHPPIIYPVAIPKDSANPEAPEFLAFLRGATARAAFEQQGFAMLNRPATGS